jgi:HlyD family secretion protein
MKTKILSLFALANLLLAACASAGVQPTVETQIPVVVADDTLIAEGRVEPIHYAEIAFNTSGMVSEVLVQEGQPVKKGESLIRLGDESDTNFAAAQLELVSAQQALDDLLESRDTDLAQAEQNLANAKQAVKDAQKDVTKLDYRRASDDLLDQTQAEIDLANEQISYFEDAYKLVKNRADGDPLKAEALLNLVNARLNRDKKQATLDWYLGKPSELDAAKYRAALSVALAQEAAAQREYDRLKDGPDASKLALLEARLNAAKAGVAAFAVTAPFDGVVADLNAKTGSSINAGEVAVTIADTSSWIVITTDVTEIDVVNLNESQPVTVTLDAIPGVNLKGKILSIGQNFSQNQGDIVYKVTILLTDKNPAMRWGMTAVVKFEQ